MTNWAERGEQERQRQIAAQRASDLARQQTSQAAETRKKDAESVIRQKLELFKKLHIEETLREIQRDIWRGKGEIDPAKISTTDTSGAVSTRLAYSLKIVSLLKTEILSKDVKGPYVHTVQTQGSAISSPANGWHKEVFGYKLTGAHENEVSEGLGASLSYALATDTYSLSVWRSAMEIQGNNVDIEQARSFVDRAFLSYAALPPPPFSQVEDIARRRREFITSNTGKYSTKDDWAERMQSAGLLHPRYPFGEGGSIRDIFTGKLQP